MIPPQPPGYPVAPPLLPFQPDFQRVDEGISVEVGREQIGFSRQQSETFYPHMQWRTQNAQYTLSDAGIWGMFKFFSDFMGPGLAFWAPGWFEIARLTAYVNPGDTLLHVEDTNSVQVGDYVCLWSCTAAVSAAKVTATTANTITIDAPSPSFLNANSTLLLQLCLARLTKPTLSMAWKRPGLAQCDLQWDEMPPEYAPAADETLGVTIGGLSKRVVLIQLTRDLLNGTVLNYYFCSYERDINGFGQTWQSNSGASNTNAPTWSVGDISKTVNLEQDTFQIDTFVFPGNPVLDDVALRAECPLSVIVKFADYEGANLTNVQTVFSGDAQQFSRKGNKLTIKCSFGPALFETQLPRLVRGTICNHLGGSNNDGSFLISAGCTLLKANWKFTGLVIGGISSAFPFTLNLGTLTGVGANAAAALAAAAVFNNWFANGWVEWGAGAAIQRRAIIGSTQPTLGNTIALTLHRYFNGLPNPNDLVTFYPGCDGLYTTCQAFNAGSNPTGKFNNYVNFGGEPFTPIANPSAAGQPNLNTQGGKK